MPTMVPSFDVGIAEVLSPTNPLGIKAGGEGGTTAAPAAVTSAILDALARLRRARHSDAGDAFCDLDGDPEAPKGKIRMRKAPPGSASAVACPLRQAGFSA